MVPSPRKYNLAGSRLACACRFGGTFPAISICDQTVDSLSDSLRPDRDASDCNDTRDRHPGPTRNARSCVGWCFGNRGSLCRCRRKMETTSEISPSESLRTPGENRQHGLKLSSPNTARELHLRVGRTDAETHQPNSRCNPAYFDLCPAGASPDTDQPPARLPAPCRAGASLLPAGGPNPGWQFLDGLRPNQPGGNLPQRRAAPAQSLPEQLRDRSA